MEEFPCPDFVVFFESYFGLCLVDLCAVTEVKFLPGVTRMVSFGCILELEARSEPLWLQGCAFLASDR